MKRTAISTALVALLILTSCSTIRTPRDKFLLARDSFTAVEKSIMAAHDSNIITDQELLGFETAILSGQSILESADGYLQRHPEGSDGFDAALATLDAITTALAKTLHNEMRDGN